MNPLNLFRRFTTWAILAAVIVGGALSYTSSEARTPQRRMLILGKTFHPLNLAPTHLYIARPEYCFTDDGVTQATHGTTVKRWTNLGSAGGYREQTTAGARPTMTLSNGKYYLAFDGGDYFDSITGNTWTAGCFSAHSLSFTQAGYYNVFDCEANSGAFTSPMLWIDASGRAELNTASGVVSASMANGAWRSFFTHTNPAAATALRSRLWVNGSRIGDSAFGSVSINRSIALFNRNGSGSPASFYQGNCSMLMFSAREPADAEIVSLATWMTANVLP